MGEATIRLRVPSRSRPGLLHEVLVYHDTGDVWCSCEDASFAGPAKRGEESCYHGREALELAGLAPAAPPSTYADPFARFDRPGKRAEPAALPPAGDGEGSTPPAQGRGLRSPQSDSREPFTALPAGVLDVGGEEAELEVVRRAAEAGLGELEERSRGVELGYLFTARAPIELIDRMAALRAEIGVRVGAAVELLGLVIEGERRLGGQR